MKTIQKTETEHKDADTMTVTLDPQNTRNLRAVARVLNTDPARLMNEWLIRDQLEDLARPGPGSEIRALMDAMEWDNAAEAESVALAVADHERQTRPAKESAHR